MVEGQPKDVLPQNSGLENEAGSSLRTTDLLNVARALWPNRVAIRFGEKITTFEDLYQDTSFAPDVV